jgi:hypothetical protein
MYYSCNDCQRMRGCQLRSQVASAFFNHPEYVTVSIEVQGKTLNKIDTSIIEDLAQHCLNYKVKPYEKN